MCAEVKVTHAIVEEAEHTLLLSDLQQFNASLLIGGESHDVADEATDEVVVLSLVLWMKKRQSEPPSHGNKGGILTPLR